MTDNPNTWQAPVWLTPSYLENVLRKFHQNDALQIEDVEIKPATAKGENYLSVMSRINVLFKHCLDDAVQEASFIMKYSFESDPHLSQITKSYDLYNTEMKMYDEVLPQLSQLLREFGDTEKLFARTLNVDYAQSAIIFEDLKVEGYVLPNRLQGMDEEHCRLVMRKLAKFHAAAAVLNTRLDGALQKFDHGIFNKYSRGFGRLFEHFTIECAKLAKNCPQLGGYYHDKLLKLQPHVLDYGHRAYNLNDPKHFLTLNHGDLWINNIMLLYNKPSEAEWKLKDSLLVDFQFSNWSSPAVDLYHFFTTSLEADKLVDMKFQDKLIQYYHAVLSATLEKLKYAEPIPTLHQLQVQLEESRFLAFTGTIGNQAVSTADTCADADFHSLIDDTERAKRFRTHCYNNKRFQRVVRTMLPYFDARGLLDVQQ